ncbi:WbuC family cupin fold metalloprotein [Marinilabilia salmonicolor]|jgi:cupin fold WbuC family metalloprotein|uniref:Cupin fold WbuC family metalloprotein n=1 Tax=Marinilabilia salmonicolor TaxID=989 RepID=A0A2T0XTJ2_9BACT|nr:WbuC family cupin fold metalloprotein [Marinilabilia salmonicolor]PRZ02238.1 cupin fold WbuC family metalloprotein [Marinilabilia salmonicolor]RCW36193.1 cupin fold WbuC family metalloprotein [Marinilabilia salmonicolor]
MKLIDESLLDALSAEAGSSDRKRKNLNYHFGDADVLQRMLNAFEPGTYVRPHKHENPAKREVFILLRGRLMMFFFDDTGRVTHRQLLDPEAGKYAVEIAPGEWHMAVSLEAGTVVYEVKDGPYDPSSDKQFAPWAPAEGTQDADVWLEKLMVDHFTDR